MGWKAPRSPPCWSRAAAIYDLSAGLTQPLFEGGRLAGAYAQSKARYQELLADYHKAVISAFDNTQDSL